MTPAVPTLFTHDHYGPYARAIAAGEVPEAFPGPLLPDQYRDVHPLLPPVNWNSEMRTFQRTRGMFAIVDQTWTARLADRLRGLRALEVMAGRGWLAKAMRQHGIHWIATDDHSMFTAPITPVERLDAVEAVIAYRQEADVLVMSWPPLNDPVCERVTCAWPAGKPIVYIGEWRGCTGTDRLPTLLEGDNRFAIDLPRYPGFSDDVHWCHRTTQEPA